MASRIQGQVNGESSRPSARTMATSFKPGAIPPAVPKPSSQQQSTLPSLCQVIAMTLTYRRLAVAWATVPLLCLSVPIICKVVLFCLNSLTQGHGFITMALTSFLVLSWYQMIRTTAPNPEKEREAYQKSQLRVPIIMFAISHGFIRLMLRVAGGGHDDETRPDSLQWTPTIQWGVGLRPALGFALIGAAVMMKFVGHNSVGESMSIDFDVECCACRVACLTWFISRVAHCFSSLLYGAFGVQPFLQCCDILGRIF